MESALWWKSQTSRSKVLTINQEDRHLLVQCARTSEMDRVAVGTGNHIRPYGDLQLGQETRVSDS